MRTNRQTHTHSQYHHGRRFLFNIGGTIDRGAEGTDVERRRRENRGAGAVGAEWGRVVDLKMVSFDAFCVVFKV